MAHGRMVDGNSKKNLVCKYCEKLFKGGGITRVKQYLAYIKGDTEMCKKVPPEVSYEMKQHIEGFAAKKRKIQETLENQNPVQDLRSVKMRFRKFQPPTCHLQHGLLSARNSIFEVS